MKRYLLTFLTIFILSPIVSFSQTESRTELANKIRKGLSTAKTTEDSIKILFDVYDVMSTYDRVDTGKEISIISKRSNNVAAQIDILRLISVNFEDEEILSKIVNEINSLPQSKQRDEAALFVKMRIIANKAKKLSEKERQQEIIKILHSFETKKADNLHRQILDLYTLVEFSRSNAAGDMLLDYIGRLEKLIDSSEIESPALKNIVYSEAASIYSDAEYYEKALETNAKVLDYLNKLEKSYRDNGRQYRNYDVSRYVVYRRMLRNAKALKPGEAEKYYQLAMSLGEKNDDVKREIDSNPRIQAYYQMAKGDYHSAIPILKEVLKHSNTLPARKQFLEMLILASTQTGDDKSRLEALEKYTSVLNQISDEKAAEKTRELQIKYDLKDLNERNSDLENKNREQALSWERSIMTFVSVAFLIMFIIFIVLLINWGRYKKNTGRMGSVVDNMHRERHRLRETIYNKDYIHMDPLSENDMYSDMTWEKRLKKSNMKIGDATIFMTESIINDLLYIAWVGHGGLTHHIKECSVDSIMRNSAAKACETITDDAPITLEYPVNDFNIDTDRECLTALLGHIFVVSNSYNPDRNVNLSCKKINDKNVDFIFTLEGKESADIDGPEIFKDMPIADVLLNYENSGMYVCRMIAMLMQCEIIPDKEYKEGARYVVRIPVKMGN